MRPVPCTPCSSAAPSPSPRSASAADAATLIGLTADNQLLRIDTETRRASAPVRVSGAAGRLVGIDVRPADGKLYGLTELRADRDDRTR